MCISSAYFNFHSQRIICLFSFHFFYPDTYLDVIHWDHGHFNFSYPPIKENVMTEIKAAVWSGYISSLLNFLFLRWRQHISPKHWENMASHPRRELSSGCLMLELSLCRLAQWRSVILEKLVSYLSALVLNIMLETNVDVFCMKLKFLWW